MGNVGGQRSFAIFKVFASDFVMPRVLRSALFIVTILHPIVLKRVVALHVRARLQRVCLLGVICMSWAS